MFLKNPKFLQPSELNSMRLSLLQLINNFIPKTAEYGMFKQALPELQNLKRIVTCDYTDIEVLVATHELCKKSFFKSPCSELEQAIKYFFKELGIKNYFERDSEDTFVRKCEYYNLIPKRSEARKPDPWHTV